jgi:hypothetical protein
VDFRTENDFQHDPDFRAAAGKINPDGEVLPGSAVLIFLEIPVCGSF